MSLLSNISIFSFPWLFLNSSFLFFDLMFFFSRLWQKAPVLSRASFLLECCHFVSRFNNGDSKLVIHAEYSCMKDAAMMFYKWGIVIGSKLEAIIAKENNNNIGMTGNVQVFYFFLFI